MAHFEHEFMGIPAFFTRDSGLDPNYRTGYQGLRTQGGSWQADYGRYRFMHADQLGSEGSDYELPSPRPAQGSLLSRQSASSM